ncbi:MAG: putative porin [Candidatus Omnitrophota bacterium]
MQLLRICFVLMLSAGIIFTSAPSLYADETSEIILRLLVKKGIITQQEIDEIGAEVATKERVIPTTLEERVAKVETDLPKWVKDTKFKGDLRLRGEYIDNDLGQDNGRTRMRLRYGFESKINDQVKVAFGLASGSSDSPTSTNQTLESEFQSKAVWIDYAEATYKPYHWLNLIGGKFKSPFFSTDMLWDSDIRFDGFAAKVKTDKEPVELYATAGYFPIDDSNTADGDDIYLVACQIGANAGLGNKFAELKTGLAYYDFNNLKGATAASLAEERGTNTYNGTYASGSTTATIAHDFRVISPSVELDFNNILGGLEIPWAIFGEYANNLDPGNNESASRGGFRLGKAKVKKKGDWKLINQYSRIEKDAFFDAFPDADFNGAGTDGKGFEAIFDYALADNIIASLDYYNTRRISADSLDEQIMQADVVFKF